MNTLKNIHLDFDELKETVSKRIPDKVEDITGVLAAQLKQAVEIV
jgi:anaerobic selenocysteine-containing dehydrogenase